MSDVSVEIGEKKQKPNVSEDFRQKSSPASSIMTSTQIRAISEHVQRLVSNHILIIFAYFAQIVFLSQFYVNSEK